MENLNAVQSLCRKNRMALSYRKDGAGDRVRTGDVQLGKLAFYH